MIPTIEAIIFDCDGTLVDSETPGLDVLYEEAVKLGVTMSREQAHAEFRGKRMSLCVEAVGNRLPHRPASFEAEFTATVRAAMAVRFRQSLAPLPGALDLVARLKQPFCVATNGPREKAELTLGLTGLLPWFNNRLFCAYEVGFWKPDPRLFLHAAQALGMPATSCAVVEDSLPGVEAGLAAGMQVFSLCAPGLLPAPLAAQVTPIADLIALDHILHPH